MRYYTDILIYTVCFSRSKADVKSIKAEDSNAEVSGTMAYCDGKLYGALRSDQDYLIDYVNVNDTTVQYMYPLQQNPSSMKSFQDDLPPQVNYDQFSSSGSVGDPESTAMDFRSRRGISAYGKRKNSGLRKLKRGEEGYTSWENYRKL